uniref:ARAD1C21186p n=1 Tax=Blastobotrys adeninivorans TaxID=409370 RepID=A0A060T207_BLAAD
MRGNDVSTMSQDLSPASNAIRDYFVKQNCQESFISIAFEAKETFSAQLQQSIEKAQKVTDEIIVYVPKGKSQKETIEGILEKLAIKGRSSIGLFGTSYILIMPGPIHQKAIAELARLLTELDQNMFLDHEGPQMITRKLHTPEDSVNRWYQAVRQELRLRDTPPPEELLSDEGDKNKEPDGDMWPCYLELIRKIQGCPFFPTYINETAVSQTTESLFFVGMQWMGATGLLVDTVILQDINKSHDGSTLESVTIYHLDCSARNLRRLVQKHRRTDNHRVLSWALRVKCQRGIECMRALRSVIQLMSDYDRELADATVADRERICLSYTKFLAGLAKNLSRSFTGLPGAHLLDPWPVSEATRNPLRLLKECYTLFSRFKRSGIMRDLRSLMDTTEHHYQELLEAAGPTRIRPDFDEEEGIRQVTEILFSERNEIRTCCTRLPNEPPEVRVEQIHPEGVEEPILAVPGTSIHGFITDSDTRSQLGRDSFVDYFEMLSEVEDSQIYAERQPVTLQVSRDCVRKDYLWDFVTAVHGPPDPDIQTVLDLLFADGSIWVTIPLLYLTTKFIRHTLGRPRGTSRSVMVKQLAETLATPDEGRQVSFTVNTASREWVKPLYRPKYDKELLVLHRARRLDDLDEQDSTAVYAHLYEIEDRALPLLCRQLGSTPPPEPHTREALITRILDIPPRDPIEVQQFLRQLGEDRDPVPRAISMKVKKSRLSNQAKKKLLATLQADEFSTVIREIADSKQKLHSLEKVLSIAPELLERVEDPEELLQFLALAGT